MTINKVDNGNELLFELEGRLDTTTAPQLDAEVAQITAAVTKVILDFKALEYISSAGLRVLLNLQKKMGSGNLIIKNVCDDIMEVFEITGFVDILTIEK